MDFNTSIAPRLQKLLQAINGISLEPTLSPIVFYQESFHFFHDLKSILVFSNGTSLEQEKTATLCEGFRNLAYATQILNSQTNKKIAELFKEATDLEKIFTIEPIIQNEKQPFTASTQHSQKIHETFGSSYENLDPLSKARALSCVQLDYTFKKNKTTLPLSELIEWEESLLQSLSQKEKNGILIAKIMEPIKSKESSLKLDLEYWIANK